MSSRIRDSYEARRSALSTDAEFRDWMDDLNLEHTLETVGAGVLPDSPAFWGELADLAHEIGFEASAKYAEDEGRKATKLHAQIETRIDRESQERRDRMEKARRDTQRRVAAVERSGESGASMGASVGSSLASGCMSGCYLVTCSMAALTTLVVAVALAASRRH
jgi:hypothetical protein